MKNNLLFGSLIISFFLSFGACKTAQDLEHRDDKVFLEYRIEEFLFEGHQAKVVFPNNPNDNRSWVWRARFWGVEPQVDMALLDQGFHIVYVDVAGLFGNDVAVQRWNRFYKHVTDRYDLDDKAVLEGLSRGGLIVYNWASENTDKVACIYADAPVCDIKSWPGGLYSGVGNERNWKVCLEVHDVDTLSVMDYTGIPLYTCINVAKANIPSLHVYGDADEVVPHKENTELLAEAFEAAGGNITLIKKEGIGHHPHSLVDPTPIVEFILTHVN